MNKQEIWEEPLYRSSAVLLLFLFVLAVWFKIYLYPFFGEFSPGQLFRVSAPVDLFIECRKRRISILFSRAIFAWPNMVSAHFLISFLRLLKISFSYTSLYSSSFLWRWLVSKKKLECGEKVTSAS